MPTPCSITASRASSLRRPAGMLSSVQFRFDVRRRRMASSRSGLGSATRSGPTGTSRISWRSRPATSAAMCKCDVMIHAISNLSEQ